MDYFTPLSNHLSSLAKMFTLLSAKNDFSPSDVSGQQSLDLRSCPPVLCHSFMESFEEKRDMMFIKDPPEFLRCSCDIGNDDVVMFSCLLLSVCYGSFSSFYKSQVRVATNFKSLLMCFMFRLLTLWPSGHSLRKASWMRGEMSSKNWKKSAGLHTLINNITIPWHTDKNPGACLGMWPWPLGGTALDLGII